MAAKHFTQSQHDYGVLSIGFSHADKSMNILSEEVLLEFNDLLSDISKNSDVRGLVIYSQKSDHFIAGADIADIETLASDKEDPETSVKHGATKMQAVFQKIAELKIPTVCAIHGVCLGGGLELALACDYRILSHDSSTKLGFPEVQLGLLPGAGGTQRLPRLIGIVSAIDLITSARRIGAKKALRLGIADAVVGQKQLLSMALSVAAKKEQRLSPRKRHLRSWLLSIALERNPLGRKVVAKAAKKKILAQSKGFYPAPIYALNSVLKGISLPLNLGLKKEAGYFAKLAMTPQSRSLIHLFHATNHIKKTPYASLSAHGVVEIDIDIDSAAQKDTDVDVSSGDDMEIAPVKEKKAQDVVQRKISSKKASKKSDSHKQGKRFAAKISEDSVDNATDADGDLQKLTSCNAVAIIGAGFMGAGIATLCAYKKVKVILSDPSSEAVGRALQYAYQFFQKRVRSRRSKSFEASQSFARISAGMSSHGFSKTDMVIEAVFEDLSLKRQILSELEKDAASDWVFASNTSAIPIADIAKNSQDPSRIIGMHFFSPAEKMPLLEVVKSKYSAHDALYRGVKLGQKLGKQVIVVDDGPGFYTTRVLAFFLAEAICLLEEGVQVEQIDQAMTRFGFPVGPLTLLDEVGIDVGAHVLDTMVKAYPKKLQKSKHVDRLLDLKKLGKKNGDGIYLYEKGKKRSGQWKKKGVDPKVEKLFASSQRASSISTEEIQRRLNLIFINESACCLDDGILHHAFDGDVGAVFGLGYPPFLGGPFYNADVQGAASIVDQLAAYAKTYGERYVAADILKKHAKNSSAFFSKIA